MSESVGKDINVVELLLKISNDVSSIKTDMTNLKESQRLEKENVAKEIQAVTNDCKRNIYDLEQRMLAKINNIQSVQNNLVGDVDSLKHSEEKRDAKRWRTVIAFIGTGLSGMLLGKLPDIIKSIFTMLNS